MNKNNFTVSEINEYIKNLLTSDKTLQNLWVTGEISNFHHHNSGHMYFTLKDEKSCINSLMFKSNNSYLKFDPEDGLKVNAHGYISLYKPRGNYQFYIDKLEPAGKGSLYLAYEQLKSKLEKEGLFEKKKPIPVLPKKIGIVTSPTGAAIRDILSVVKRRFENVSVLIYPSLVQGEQAASQIINGIDYLNKSKDIDLIIISRGGGSIEDLWPFNEEVVARAINNSRLPIISGVGHETDFTIADFAADLRAPTPSAAAELAISSRLELEKHLQNYTTRLVNSMFNKIEKSREQINALASKRILNSPEEMLAVPMQKLDEYNKELNWQIKEIMNKKKEKCLVLSSKLESLSPLKTLTRGYSLTVKDNNIIDKLDKVNIGDNIITHLQDGTIVSSVKSKKRKER
ncbi:MAG: exodeoxyribonuclease VII large subunit [Halothermotrichaceae bacterium]